MRGRFHERIIVDQATWSQLRGVAEAVEFAMHRAKYDGMSSICKWRHEEDLEPPISDEELARRSNERRGRSLAEIMADLEKRV